MMKKEITKKIEADTNNAKQNIKELMDKIKFYSTFDEVLDKEIKNK